MSQKVERPRESEPELGERPVLESVLHIYEGGEVAEMQVQSGLDALREVPAVYSIGRGPVLLAPLVLSVLDVEARVAAFPCETRAEKQCVILSPFADLPAYESCRAGEPYAACLLSERETLPDGDVEEVSWGVVVPCGFMVVARCRQCRCLRQLPPD